ncbi:MAG: 50S ribosomal protein L10 [Anaerofustis stercorihominis]|nr:50S ribosomal protein L10 [Anaerofustis stercorihominis]
MASQVILAQKQAVVAEIVDKMKNCASFVLVDYQGINAEQVTALRAKARAMNVEYKIYKNTMLTLAAKECGFEGLEDALKGSTAIAFADDAVAPAKCISEFVKDNKLQILKFKGGVIDGKVSGVEEIQAIAALPPKDVLIAQVVGGIKSPITKFALVIKAIADKKGEETA